MYKQPLSAAQGAMAQHFILADAKKAAQFFAALATHEAVTLLQAVSADALARLAAEMEVTPAAAILRRMNIKQAALILSRVNTARGALILNAFPAHFKKNIERELTPEVLARLSGAHAYEAFCAGALCTGAYFAFKTDDKISDIIEKFKNLPRKKMAHIVYITTKDGALAGILKTGDIVFLKDDASAGSAMMKEFISLPAAAAKEQILQAFKEADINELPVTGENNILLGVVNIRAVLDAPKGLIKKLWRV